MTVADFTSEVFTFIEVSYGKSVIKRVKAKKNNDVVERIMEDSRTKEYSVDKTAHKLMAMLRVIP